LEKTKKEQQEAIKLQDDENKTLMKELETCRINAIKEVAKIKDEFNESLAEVMENGSCHEELLKQQLNQLREQSKSLSLQLEEQNHQIAAGEKSKQELELTVEKLSLELQDRQREINEKKSGLTKENSQLSEQLRAVEKEIAQLKELKSTEHPDYEDIAKRLEKKAKSEKALRVEMAQLRSEVARKKSNEKHLEDHVASLEEQINELVSEYESKLQLQATTVAHE
jgi:chromosome segregation ATPase